MTNKEKIARIEKMHKEATEMVAYCQKQMAEGDTSWTLPYSIEVFKQDAAALKYALKGLRLMQELVNDKPKDQSELPTEVLEWLESLPYNKKVKARLKRQMAKERVDYIPSGLQGAIIYDNSPEGADYWFAVDNNEPNPDQYLPEGYMDVEDKGGEQ